MVVTEEVIAAGHACVSLEYGVSIQTANDGGRRRVDTSLLRLFPNTEKIGQEVSIYEVSSVCSESGGAALHVES